MNYKVAKVFKYNKKYIIVFIAIWIILEWLIAAPIAVAISKSMGSEKFAIGTFVETLVKEMGSFSSLTRVFSINTIGIYGRTTLFVSVIYLIFLTIGLVKSKPKNEFTDIEHGSSDWSEGGEQYRVLSKNKGIILAENNYLPVNKPGNVNVLIVGRIWCR